MAVAQQKALRVAAAMPVDAADRLPLDLWRMIGKHKHARDSLLRTCKATRDVVIAEIRKEHKLTAHQAFVFARVVLCGQSLFLTGVAGSGKSHLLRTITQHMCRATDLDGIGRDRIAVCCPTGAAARVASAPHLHAVTIHKFFNIQSRQRDPRKSRAAQLERRSVQELELAALNVDADFEPCEEEHVRGVPTAILNKDTKQRCRRLRFLVIDEISMVSAEMLELVTDALQLARDDPRPFGNCQVLATGDFWQLSPVQTAGTMRWAFQSKYWRFAAVELKQQMRQRDDPAFGAIMTRMRSGKATRSDVDYINRHCCKDARRVPHISLFPYHKLCTKTNMQRIDAVPGPHRVYTPELTVVELLEDRPFWRTRPVSVRQKVLPPGTYTNVPLKLAVGCRVSSTRNVYREPRGIHDMVVSNHQRGTVVRLGVDHVAVQWDPVGSDPPLTTVVRPTATMRRQRFTSPRGFPVYAAVHSLALKLAYAITLHASQGGTFKNHALDIDVTSRQPPPSGEGPWQTSPAAAYVALSRASTLSAVRLVHPLRFEHLKIDPTVRAWAAAGCPTANTTSANTTRLANTAA